MTTTGIATPSALLALADLVYPPTGTIGHKILLSGSLAIGLGFTVSGNVLTTSAAHKLVTNSRVRIVSTGTLPPPLQANTDYYAIVLSPTTLSLSATLNGSAIALTGTGTGTLTLNEQALTTADPIAVLINKELPGTGGYQRMPLTNVGAAAISGNYAQKIVNNTLVNSGSSNIDYLYSLTALGANSTIGSTAGITAAILETEASTVTTLPTQSRTITTTLVVGSI